MGIWEEIGNIVDYLKEQESKMSKIEKDFLIIINNKKKDNWFLTKFEIEYIHDLYARYTKQVLATIGITKADYKGE